MNELQTLWNAEIEKQRISKRTLKELQREQFAKSRKFCKEMVDKLSFLSSVGCKVRLDDTNARFFIDYPYNGGINGKRTAEVKLKSVYKIYEGQRYACYYAEERFYVDWNYNVCHNDKDDYLTTEGLIRKLARIASN